MLEIRLAHSQVSLDQLKAELETHPGGRMYDPPSAVVQPARLEADGRFDVMPVDVAEELRQYASSAAMKVENPAFAHSHVMISRRMNRTMNSIGTQLSGTLKLDPYNPAYMHPSELAALGLAPGDRVEIASEHDRIETFAAADATVRPGVISIAHCWGGLPDEEDAPGANTNLLVACDKHVEPINAMPRMSAIPVNIRKLPTKRPSPAEAGVAEVSP
jgi:anaerobic selenocysteine-containing dehydrogenase